MADQIPLKLGANNDPAKMAAGDTVPVANGGTGATTPAGARTNLEGTTVGQSFFTLANPSAIRFPRINVDNTVSALDAAAFRTAIGAGTGSGSGTVTSVAVANATGITWTGSPITTSGTLTPTLSANLQAWSDIAPSSKADASALADYVLKAGDTMTGPLHVDAGGEAPKIIVERNDAASNVSIEYRATGGSVFAGYGYSDEFRVGSAQDLSVANAWIRIGASNFQRVIGGTSYDIWHAGNFTPGDYTPTSRTLTAGNGLTGGGTLAADRTFTLGTPSNVTLASTNSVTTTSHTHAFAPGGTTAQYIRGDGSLATFPAIPAGTVTSVAVANATGITWTGSPITTSGTLTPTLSANLQAWHALATSAKQDSGYITAGTTYARLHGSNGDASGGCIRITGTPNLQYTVDGTVVWGVNASGAITVGTIPYGSVTSVPANLASWDSYASSTFFTVVAGGGTSVKWHTNTGPAGGEFRITGTPTFYFTNNGVDLLIVNSAGNMTVAGNVTANGRFSCGSVIATGADLSSHLALYGTTYGLNVNSSVVNVVAGGNIVASFPTNGNFSATGSVSDAIGNVRDVIGVTRNSTTAFSAADAGKAIVKTNTTAYTWAVNTSVWYYGMTVTVINDGSAGNVTISQGASMTLISGGTTGNFTLAPGESRTLFGLSATRVRVL